MLNQNTDRPHRWQRALLAMAGAFLTVTLVGCDITQTMGVSPTNATPPSPSNRPQSSSPPVHSVTPIAPMLPAAALLDVPPQAQLPQLPNGCEVTSLSMLLTAVGHPVNKMTLAAEEPTDPTPKQLGSNGQIVYWGDPNKGFVGHPDQRTNGFGIYHGPLAQLLNQILPGRAEDLTGHSFTDILQVVAEGTPVEAWTTATLRPTNMWMTWGSPDGPIRVTLQEHAVLIVGYDSTQLFINNPLNGMKAQAVNRQDFIAAWKQLGEQALTVKPLTGSNGN